MSKSRRAKARNRNRQEARAKYFPDGRAQGQALVRFAAEDLSVRVKLSEKVKQRLKLPC
jgi:hypothetical protein